MLIRSPLVREVYSRVKKLPAIGGLTRWGARILIPSKTRVWIKVEAAPLHGMRLWIDPRFESHLIQGSHEPAVQRILTEVLQPGDCFCDVGAHIGIFSILAARLVGNTGRVVAFEPDAANTDVLAANSRENEFTSLEIVQAAAWSSTCTLCFERSHPESSGMQGHVLGGAPSHSSFLEVNGIALDDFFYAANRRLPDVLKIDVEGAESEVFKGSARILRERHPCILCEVHDFANAGFIEGFLAAAGYSLRPLNEDRAAYPFQIFASTDSEHRLSS